MREEMNESFNLTQLFRSFRSFVYFSMFVSCALSTDTT